jgi:hypothetical protein
MRSLALSLAPVVVFLACGGGKPAETGGTGTSAEGPTPVPTTAATTTAAPSASADDGDDEDASIPTADVLCKHIGDVLKGKAPALAACIAEFEKKQVDDLNGYVCQATCVMSANAADAVEACKAKCKK